jgi:hypothetical protein
LKSSIHVVLAKMSALIINSTSAHHLGHMNLVRALKSPKSSQHVIERQVLCKVSSF